MSEDQFQEIVDKLREAESILFITGAGLSADSGLPTYRGQSGLYTKANPEEGIAIEDILSGSMLRNRPELTWKYLIDIEKACRGAHFNDGHRVIADFEKSLPRVWTLTQNIDGFHRDAGTQKLIEMHGTFKEISCTVCEYNKAVDNYEDLELPPRCPDCGALIRPAVVLFGEQLPADALEDYSRELSRGFDIVFSIGTSSRFPYITDPVFHHYYNGAMTIEINPEKTDVSPYTHFQLRLSASDALTKLWEIYKSD